MDVCVILSAFWSFMVSRRPDGSVGVGLASADRLPVVVRIPAGHSGVSSATRRKATGANQKKIEFHGF